MRNLTKLFVIIVMFQGCIKDDIVYECEDSEFFLECVTEEAITSTATGFLEYEIGDQEIGIAKGIKINREWEASLLVYGFDSLFTFGPKTLQVLVLKQKLLVLLVSQNQLLQVVIIFHQ